MFILTSFIDRRRKKISEWEETYKKIRDNYVEPYGGSWGVDPYGGSWDASIWAKNHPRPTAISTLVRRTILVILVVLLGFAIGYTINEHNSPKQRAARQVITAKNCGKFDLNDTVKIQYGTYKGGVGRIIGGCNTNNYLVTFNDGVQIDVTGSSDLENVGGKTIRVNSSANLQKID